MKISIRGGFISMRVWLLVFLSLSPGFALKGRRTVTAAEQASRLVTSETSIVSSGCAGSLVKVVADVSERGTVTNVHPFKSNVSDARPEPGRLQRFVDQAKRLVSGFRYRPMLVGGKAKPVRALVEIPCLSPQEGHPQP